MAVINIIDKGLAESQQQVINLTEPDYDVYPLYIEMEADIYLRIDLDIYSMSMAGDTMIWGHPTQGLWGEKKWGNSSEVGFILGHPKYGLLGTSKLGTSAATWVLEEELINV